MRIRGSVGLSLVLLGIAGGAHRLLPSPAQDPDLGLIAFVSERDGIEDIYVMKPDGSHVRRVAVTEPVEGEMRGSWVPAWSPDRTRIVFASNRDDGGSANLYVVDADGRHLRRLTKHDGFDYTPDWSPDGTTIAFLSNRDGFYELYAMDVDGSNVRRLTHLEAPEGRLFSPDWSPDGRQIVFTTRTPRAEIQVLDVESGRVERVASGALPRWSPDGEWIAYWVPGGQVYVMRRDGSDSRRVSDVEGIANYPTWSPDGEWIVFDRLPGQGDVEGAELYIVRADGSEQKPLTTNRVLDGHPNWW